MNYFKFITLLIFGLTIGLPLSAEENGYEKSFPIAQKQRILIDQQRLRLVTIGVNFYPVTTRIRSYEGTDLIVRLDQSCTFGFKNPVEVDAEDTEGELRLILGFRNSTTVGINIGSLDVEILIPSDWNGDLDLQKLKSDTVIENLDLRSIKGKASITKLSMSYCSFSNMEIDLGTDTDLSMYSTDVGNCSIKGGMGKITGKKIEGTLDVETFDGDISIGFSDFTGKTSLVSTTGRITAGLPEGVNTDIDLTSKLGAAKCEVSLSSSSQLSKGRKRGSIGNTNSGNLISLRSGDGDVILVTACGPQL